jgi:hypothetical protein
VKHRTASSLFVFGARRRGQHAQGGSTHYPNLADHTVLARHVEEMLADMFPKLKGKAITFASLTKESDVEKFERSLPESL